MIRSYEEDEFIAVRVQDPRVQNQGSWNSYVDFKIFLHTNSKAFTAKTSCVRRRYSEFVWLKKKMQKNCGLVQVPDLPSKSYFSFINEDFLEKRRKGLQSFLDKVLHMTVCLSDSQLHLFLQTQLPIGHIQDCVQGHTPYTVTDAILTYASSNQGWAQEEDVIPERTPTPVPYESMESPAPHLPTLPSEVLPNPVLLTSSDPEDIHTEESISDLYDTDTGELQCTSLSLIALQEDSRLEVHCPVETTSAGDDQVDSSLEVHCPVETTSAGDHQVDSSLEVHCPVETTSAGDHQMDSLLEVHCPVETTSAGDHQVDSLLEVHCPVETTSAGDHQVDSHLEVHCPVETTSDGDDQVDSPLEVHCPVETTSDGDDQVDSSLEVHCPVETTSDGDDQVDSRLEVHCPVETTSDGDDQVDSPLEVHCPVETTSAGDHQMDCQRQTSVEIHCLEGEEEEFLVIVEKVLEREHSEERIPHTHSTCETVCHEVERPGEPLETAVGEPASHVTMTQVDHTLQETSSGEDTHEPGQQDDGEEHLHETDSHTETHHEDHEETAAEAQNGQEATQETNIVEVDDEEGDSDEEIDLLQEMDLDRQSQRETSSEESSVGDIMIGDANHVELSLVTNGFQETQREDEHHSTDSTDVALCNTDTREKATDDPPQQDSSDEADSVQEEIVCVKAREEEEISYMTNSYPAETQEELPLGMVDVVEETQNSEVQENNHLESSDDHSTEEVILLTTEPDSEVTLKSHEREVYESAADANLTVNQDKELQLSLHTHSD